MEVGEEGGGKEGNRAAREEGRNLTAGPVPREDGKVISFSLYGSARM